MDNYNFVDKDGAGIEVHPYTLLNGESVASINMDDGLVHVPASEAPKLAQAILNAARAQKVEKAGHLIERIARAHYENGDTLTPNAKWEDAHPEDQAYWRGTVTSIIAAYADVLLDEIANNLATGGTS